MAEIKDTMQRVAGTRNPIEELLLKIPGFQGYLNKQYRRESDKLHRDYLAKKLDETKRHINGVKNDLVDDGKIFQLDKIDTVLDKLDSIISRIRYADRGYSGFFDTNKIEDRELELIHQLDLALVEQVTAVERAIGALSSEQDDGDLKTAIKAAVMAVETLTGKFAERDDIVSGVA